MDQNKINRRDFLLKGAKAAAIGAFAFSSFDIVKLAAASKDSETIKSTGADKVINISDYPSLGSAGGYEEVAKNILVIRTSSSKFLAINTVCTHKKCDVDFDGSSFECPCHGSTYSKTGKVTGGPSTKNLRTYKTVYNADNNTLTIKM
jgi:cytochrome b6-f complex iron-sulfur subunit